MVRGLGGRGVGCTGKEDEEAKKDQREEQEEQERKKKRTDMKGGAEGGDTNKAPTDRN